MKSQLGAAELTTCKEEYSDRYASLLAPFRNCQPCPMHRDEAEDGEEWESTVIATFPPTTQASRLVEDRGNNNCVQALFRYEDRRQLSIKAVVGSSTACRSFQTAAS